MSAVKLDGLVPDRLAVRSSRILLENLEVMTDIGFHDFEIGTPQRLLITVELWMASAAPPEADEKEAAWDYDFLRREVVRIAGERRYNLQETLLHRLYDRLAALRGIAALRIRSVKPDVYPDAEAVGVEIASFDGPWPNVPGSCR